MFADKITIYSYPTTAQQATFATFSQPQVATVPAADTFKNQVGMYVATTEKNGDFYAMWMQYLPTFTALGIKEPVSLLSFASYYPDLLSL